MISLEGLEKSDASSVIVQQSTLHVAWLVNRVLFSGNIINPHKRAIDKADSTKTMQQNSISQDQLNKTIKQMNNPLK